MQPTYTSLKTREGSWTPRPRNVSYLDTETFGKDTGSITTPLGRYSTAEMSKFDEREAAGPPVEEEEAAQQPLILDSESEAESDNERGIDEEVNDDADPPAAEPPPRRSTRERRPVDYYGLPQAHLTIHREPTTFDEATACPERAKWEGAMGREMQSLKDNEVWELTSLPPGKGAIGCKWVYKVKTNSDGSLEHYKARLVARGFDQRYGLDYDETFCPVVRLESLRTLIALSTQQGLEPGSHGCSGTRE